MLNFLAIDKGIKDTPGTSVAYLDSCVSTLQVWLVFFLGENFLIKSILTACAFNPNPHGEGLWQALPSHF